jgi:hypothetical protein
MRTAREGPRPVEVEAVKVLTDPNVPTIAVLEIQTADGIARYGLLKESVEHMALQLQRAAARMLSRSELS